MKHSQKKVFSLGTGIAQTIAKVAVVVIGTVFLCSSMTYQSAVSEAVENDTVSNISEIEACAIEIPAENNEEEISFLNPVEGVLTSAFGERWGRKHTGVDIGADFGHHIVAAADGEITFAGEMDGYGNYIVIEHQKGFETSYAHCSRIAVTVGDYVKKGQIIGYVGSTGNSTGPHLHFEVKKDGEFLNPVDYVVY